jgi:hypothetical protein
MNQFISLLKGEDERFCKYNGGEDRHVIREVCQWHVAEKDPLCSRCEIDMSDYDPKPNFGPFEVT